MAHEHEVAAPSLLAPMLALGTGFLLVLAISLGALRSGAESAEREGAEGVVAPLLSRPRFDYWHRVLPPTPISEPDRAPRPEGPVESWSHDQLADIADPNVLQPGYLPLRYEEGPEGAKGPRLAIAGLDERQTVDLGAIPISRALQFDLGLVNVGDAPLTFSRVYPSMSALAFQLAGAERAASGTFVEPLSIVPGERVTLTLRLEPTRLPGPGTRSIILQIFSNDPAHEAFDAGDPLSHETRLRVVFEARGWRALQRPIAPAELDVAEGAPRLWLPELAHHGRGGDVLDLGALPSTGPTTATLRIANVGRGLLEIDPDPAPRQVGRPARILGSASLAPGGSTVLTFTLRPPPEAQPDFQVATRSELRLSTNDPLAPEVLVALRAAFGGEGSADEEEEAVGENEVEGAGGKEEVGESATPDPIAPSKAWEWRGADGGWPLRTWPGPPPGSLLPTPPSDPLNPWAPPYPAPGWRPEDLAETADPNVVAQEFRIYRAEDATEPPPGPRLGARGLNEQGTFTMGRVADGEKLVARVELLNLGTEPLAIRRIYAGCGCLSPALGDATIDNAGWLEEDLQLDPGRSVALTLTLNADLMREYGVQAKFVQVFSNDDSRERFDPADDHSHESRLRVVVEHLRGPGEGEARVDGAHCVVAGMAGASDGSGSPCLRVEWSGPRPGEPAAGTDLGGRAPVLDLGRVTVEGPIVRLLLLANEGRAPLEVTRLDGASAAISVTPSSAVLPPGGALPLRVVIDPTQREAEGDLLREAIRFQTNDPLRPEVRLPLRGRLIAGGATGRAGVGDLEFGGDRRESLYTVRPAAATRLPIPVPVELVAPSPRTPRLWLPDLEPGRPWLDAGPVDGRTATRVEWSVENRGNAPLVLSEVRHPARSPGVEPRLDGVPIAPGERHTLSLILRPWEPAIALTPALGWPERARAFPGAAPRARRVRLLLLRSNDPLVPELSLPVRYEVVPLGIQ